MASAVAIVRSLKWLILHRCHCSQRPFPLPKSLDSEKSLDSDAALLIYISSQIEFLCYCSNFVCRYQRPSCRSTHHPHWRPWSDSHWEFNCWAELHRSLHTRMELSFIDGQQDYLHLHGMSNLPPCSTSSKHLEDRGHDVIWHQRLSVRLQPLLG